LARGQKALPVKKKVMKRLPREFVDEMGRQVMAALEPPSDRQRR